MSLVGAPACTVCCGIPDPDLGDWERLGATGPALASEDVRTGALHALARATQGLVLAHDSVHDADGSVLVTAG